MKASSQDSMIAARAGESLGMRPRRTCGRSLGMGSDRCSIGMARARNCSDVSIKNRRGTACRAPTEILSGLGAAVRTVAGPAKPVAVVEDHRLVADGPVRRLRVGFCDQVSGDFDSGSLV